MAAPAPTSAAAQTSTESKLLKSPTHIFDDELYQDQYSQELGDDELNIGQANLSFSTSTSGQATEEKSIDDGFKVSVAKTFTIDYEDGIFCMKWSPDGQYLAVGCADGGVRVLRGADGKLAYKLSTSGSQPVTALKWKPSLSNVGSSSTLISTSSYGCIDIWHVQSSKCIYSINEEENQIFAFDISPESKTGFKFASAGKDKIIRVYDDETKKLIVSLERGYMTKNVGHSNRIFALKWKPDDANIIMSAGWDNSVLFWDLRSKQCFRSIFGPHIAGQAIDIQNDIVVTGSWSVRDTIHLFEFSTGKELKHPVRWNPSPMIYSLSYSPSVEGVIAAGGTGINTARIINTNNGEKSAAITLSNNKGIYCLDWEPKGSMVAVAGNSADIALVPLQ